MSGADSTGCGCRNPGSEWALEMAKHNLANNYLVVGITEELADFVAILEATLPRYFTGALELYNTGQWYISLQLVDT